MKTNQESIAAESDAEEATPELTRAEWLGWSRLGYTKVRHSFVQTPPVPPKGSTPGTLSKLSRNHRAAVLYLAVLANWAWMSREPDPMPAGAWIRFLTSDQPQALTWTPQSLSHAWSVLEKEGLIERPRKGRLIEVKPRREDGSGAYTSPEGTGDAYFVLPNAFWTEQHFGVLPWPALAVLLILLKETGTTSSAELLIDRASPWYGISRSVADEGLTDLRNRGLISTKDNFITDSKTAKGRRIASRHTPLSPFATDDRDRLRAEAQARMDKKSATVAFTGEESADAEEAETP